MVEQPGNKKSPKGQNRSDHMANERTFLAWVRTSIAIMAFGFVVEKFALFIKGLEYSFERRVVLGVNHHIEIIAPGRLDGGEQHAPRQHPQE